MALSMSARDQFNTRKGSFWKDASFPTTQSWCTSGLNSFTVHPTIRDSGDKNGCRCVGRWWTWLEISLDWPVCHNNRSKLVCRLRFGSTLRRRLLSWVQWPLRSEWKGTCLNWRRQWPSAPVNGLIGSNYPWPVSLISERIVSFPFAFYLRSWRRDQEWWV